MNWVNSMKTLRLDYCLLLFGIVDTAIAYAQGRINFDARNNWIGTYYVESGIAFQVVLPRGGSYDYMRIGYGAGNTPYNGTPWIGWIRQNNPYSYVSLSRTDGALFGLIAVDLADPIYPIMSPIAISFVGYLFGGATITNTFTTPGGGAH
ncbi:MAG: hypothetical protein KatS3mg132_894 [Limisphaera sp.]|nr:MAG: hypothetical protein KatS3mg132_894 [Limisphaera sp.]